MALDRYQREIDYLRISITDRCNLGCVYCMPRGRREDLFAKDEIMTPDEMVRIVRVATEGFGVRKVRLTGGEPLLREDLVSIVSRLSALGIKDLSLTTNGQLLGNMAGGLKDAGLDRVNVSLDSLQKERYPTHAVRNLDGQGKH